MATLALHSGVNSKYSSSNLRMQQRFKCGAANYTFPVNGQLKERDAPEFSPSVGQLLPRGHEQRVNGGRFDVGRVVVVAQLLVQAHHEAAHREL